MHDKVLAYVQLTLLSAITLRIQETARPEYEAKTLHLEHWTTLVVCNAWQ